MYNTQCSVTAFPTYFNNYLHVGITNVKS